MERYHHIAKRINWEYENWWVKKSLKTDITDDTSQYSEIEKAVRKNEIPVSVVCVCIDCLFNLKYFILLWPICTISDQS